MTPLPLITYHDIKKELAAEGLPITPVESLRVPPSTIIICLECGDGSEVQQRFWGTEGWCICTQCEAVEGAREEITLDEWEERFG